MPWNFTGWEFSYGYLACMGGKWSGNTIMHLLIGRDCIWEQSFLFLFFSSLFSFLFFFFGHSVYVVIYCGYSSYIL